MQEVKIIAIPQAWQSGLLTSDDLLKEKAEKERDAGNALSSGFTLLSVCSSGLNGVLYTTLALIRNTNWG